MEHEQEKIKKLQLGLAGLASSLKDARLEVAGGIVEAADVAQHTIRLEELLEQERAEKSDLEQQVSLAPSPLLPPSYFPPSAILVRTHARANPQVKEQVRARDEALGQVSEVRERNLRAIQGLMDDVAKADVVGVRGVECGLESGACAACCAHVCMCALFSTAMIVLSKRGGSWATRGVSLVGG